jgi:hypothetical protein
VPIETPLMASFDVNLYGEVPGAARFVALWWDSRPIPPQHDLRLGDLLRGLPGAPGLYAITGRHDAHAGGGMLYIGQATTLAARVLQSAEGHLLEIHHGKDVRMYADVWDLTVRWARLDAHLLDAVERLLIMSHVPPFNAQLVSQQIRCEGPPDAERDLVVMSAGRKGPLLPIVAGAYQSRWRDIHSRHMGPDEPDPTTVEQR